MDPTPNPWEVLLDEQAVERAARVVAAYLSANAATVLEELRLLVDEYLTGDADEAAAKLVALLGGFAGLTNVAVHAFARSLREDPDVGTTLDDLMAALGGLVEDVHALRRAELEGRFDEEEGE